MQAKPNATSFRWKMTQIDWLIVGLLVCFAAISIMLIQSAIVGQGVAFAHAHEKQLINYGIAFIVFFVLSGINYRVWIASAGWWYVAGIGSLVAVYVWGATKNGARGWFTLPGIGFDVQPAELMKWILILMLAAWLGRRGKEVLRFWIDIVPMAVLVLLPFGLVLMQPDLGNALIYGVVFIGMLWVARLRWTVIASFILLVVMAGFVFFYAVTTYHAEFKQFLEERGAGHWMERIDTFLYPEKASVHATYQVTNSLRAIGSGSLMGEGYMKGDSVHGGFIPYTYSDSIFVVLGEEFGFLGASFLLVLYFLLLYRIVWMAINYPEPSGKYVLIGVVVMLSFQIVQNIGMFLALLPLTGITLPFISYGGTSVLMNMACMGLAMSVHLHSDANAAEHQLAQDRTMIQTLVQESEEEIVAAHHEKNRRR